MRVLGSTVLVFEWLIIALGVPVAINTAGVPARGAWVFLGVTTVLIVAAIALITRPVGVALGWAVQVCLLMAGLVVPLLAVLGLLFAALYFAAIRLAQRVDEARRAQVSAPGAQGDGSVSDTEHAGDGA